ncbi:MAG TPA: subclass B3 metallo-beta-lactamase [Steroidobacteraceae bacterium]|nr:subclass B3 metallo-beta-lactamase [Steroidobacteraceae bacterium]
MRQKIMAMRSRWSGQVKTGLAVLLGTGIAAGAAYAAAKSSCAECAAWNAPHKPFKIYGDTYYVGTAGLSAILITTEFGHVLIDGGLPESAPVIKANIETLGFTLKDVKAIFNSHVHPDHAGGIAELQKESGADVYALRPAYEVLTTGKPNADDPQAARKGGPGVPKVERAWVAQDDQQIGIAGVRMHVVATPGHTPGGTTWTWDACEGTKCLHMVYADSLSPVSADKYRFSDHPEVLQGFEKSFARIASLPCDVLLTPHPSASQLFERLDLGKENTEAVRDPEGCKKYVATARDALAKRLESEKTGGAVKK